MSKYQEVEVKYPLLNKDEVVEKIAQLSIKPKILNQLQRDTYYTPAHKNFLEHEIVSEWLRVRETKDKCSLNFKQWLPIGAKIQNQCNEYETVVEDAYALKMILSLLDFKEIIVVNKTRNSWIYKDVEISIDYIDGLGSFIELEALKKVTEEEIPSVHELFNEIIEEISAVIGQRDHRGYPYLLLEKKQKGNNNAF